MRGNSGKSGRLKNLDQWRVIKSCTFERYQALCIQAAKVLSICAL